jgi:hypothetical protein
MCHIQTMERERIQPLREKLLWRKYSLHIESASLFLVKSEHIVHPPSSSLFDGQPHCLSCMIEVVEAQLEGT